MVDSVSSKKDPDEQPISSLAGGGKNSFYRGFGRPDDMKVNLASDHEDVEFHEKEVPIEEKHQDQPLISMAEEMAGEHITPTPKAPSMAAPPPESQPIIAETSPVPPEAPAPIMEKFEAKPEVKETPVEKMIEAPVDMFETPSETPKHQPIVTIADHPDKSLFMTPSFMHKDAEPHHNLAAPPKPKREKPVKMRTPINFRPIFMLFTVLIIVAAIAGAGGYFGFGYYFDQKIAEQNDQLKTLENQQSSLSKAPAALELPKSEEPPANTAPTPTTPVVTPTQTESPAVTQTPTPSAPIEQPENPTPTNGGNG